SKRTRAAELRELESRAIFFAMSMGFLATTRMLRTSPFAATAIPGRATMFSMRWYSMAGMMAMSAAPRRRASAHCEGTVKERSYLSASGPSANPQTSGAVLRYSTIEMRSLAIFGEIVTHGRGTPCDVRAVGGGQNGSEWCSGDPRKYPRLESHPILCFE